MTQARPTGTYFNGYSDWLRGRNVVQAITVHIRTFVLNARKDILSLFLSRNKKNVFLRAIGNHFEIIGQP